MKSLLSLSGYSTRLHRTLALCLTSVLVSFLLSLASHGFEKSQGALLQRSPISERSESNVLNPFSDQNNTLINLIEKRAFTPQQAYDNALTKYGRPSIICNLPFVNNPGKKGFPPQSAFQDASAIDSAPGVGWSNVVNSNDADQSSNAITGIGNIATALTLLGAIPGSAGTLTNIDTTQDQEDYNDATGATWREATYGYYYSTVNIETGLFIAADNQSPGDLLNKNPASYATGQKPPALTNWSDVVFLQWWGEALRRANNNRNQALTKAKNIKWFARFHIINPETQNIINVAFTNVGLTLQPWPGHDFLMSTDEGKAILGSPNGRGVAFFLYQHKDQLGIKTIDSVTVFSTQGIDPNPPGGPQDYYNMIFNVKTIST